MPNVQRLLAEQGTTFADAIDSFPLCCPARATFITGQYAHNHGVEGNFAPYGWYGMKDRENTLPAWLAGRRLPDGADRQVAERLRRARRPRRGPEGLRHLARAARRLRLRLLQLRHEHRRQAAKPGATPSSPASWSSSRTSRSTTSPTALAVDLRQARGGLRPAPVQLLGRRDDRGLLARRDRRDHRASWSRPSARRSEPFFIWWAPAAPHREDVATTLMGRPGPDPRPPPRYEDASKGYTLPRPPSFNEADISDKPSNFAGQGAGADRGADRPAAARLRGPGRLAAGGRRPRRQAGQDPAADRPARRTR